MYGFFFAAARANINEGLADILSFSTYIAWSRLSRPGFETPRGACDESLCPSTDILDTALILIRFDTGTRV
jgi:hypothetical protein